MYKPPPTDFDASGKLMPPRRTYPLFVPIFENLAKRMAYPICLSAVLLSPTCPVFLFFDTVFASVCL